MVLLSTTRTLLSLSEAFLRPAMSAPFSLSSLSLPVSDSSVAMPFSRALSRRLSHLSLLFHAHVLVSYDVCVYIRGRTQPRKHSLSHGLTEPHWHSNESCYETILNA